MTNQVNVANAARHYDCICREFLDDGDGSQPDNNLAADIDGWNGSFSAHCERYDRGNSPSLTPEMIKLLFYKGLGAAAVGMMIVGTWIGRGGRDKIRQAEESHVAKPVSPDQRVDDLALQEGAAGLLSDNAASYGEKAETPEHLNSPSREG